MATATPRLHLDIYPRTRQKHRARKSGVVGCQLQRRSVVAITPRCAAVSYWCMFRERATPTNLNLAKRLLHYIYTAESALL